MSDRLLQMRFTAAFLLAMAAVLALVTGFGLAVVRRQVAAQWQERFDRTATSTLASLKTARENLSLKAQEAARPGAGDTGKTGSFSIPSPTEPIQEIFAVNGKRLSGPVLHPATLPGGDAVFSALWRKAMTTGRSSGFEWCAGARVCVVSYQLLRDGQSVTGAARWATVLEDRFLNNLASQTGDEFALVYQGQVLHATLPLTHRWIGTLRPWFGAPGMNREFHGHGLRARAFAIPVAGRRPLWVVMLHHTAAEQAILTKLLWQSLGLGLLLLLLLGALFYYLLQLTGRALSDRAVILAEKGRLAAVGELASGIAHEVNNPLTAIRGYAQMLQRKAPPEGRESGIYGEIIKEADHIHQIVRSLLGIARPPSGLEDSFCRVEDALGDTLAMARMHGCHRDRTLVIDSPPDLNVTMPRTQLVQVLLNLCVNALQASAAGQTVRLSAHAHEDRVVLEVADEGQGIAPEHLPRLFDPFFTTKPPGEGTGLGLSVCQRLVNEAGGTLTVKSSVGQGTTFTLTLPRANEHNEPPP